MHHWTFTSIYGIINARKTARIKQKPCTWRGTGMYRYSNGQISLSDFHQPMGMQLKEDNRWVKKAQMIPWDKIETKYADLFPSSTGNVAKPLQLALGACLIQKEYGYSDEEIVLQIQENPYLQYF